MMVMVMTIVMVMMADVFDDDADTGSGDQFC